MLLDQDLLRFIFGLKLRSARQEKGMSLKVLARASGLSPSYINEIEKGKKYPKTDKIITLAKALQVPYDELISLRLRSDLHNITQFLERNMLKGLPFEVFGIPAATLFELIADRPQQLSALIGTLLELARAHHITVEDFFAATLRAFLDMNRNFFPELEERVKGLSFRPEPKMDQALVNSKLKELLEQQYHYHVSIEDFSSLSPELRSVAFFFHKRRERAHLSINAGLSAQEQAFVLAKELGNAELQLKERPESSLSQLDSYDSLLNNLKASYFASALLIPLEHLVTKLGSFFQCTTWDPEAFQDLARAYPVTPLAFYHRLAQVLPTYFELGEIFLIRFAFDTEGQRFFMINELHLSQLHGPHRVSHLEHYCRRWITASLLENLASEQRRVPLTAAQRSTFNSSQKEYLCLATAFGQELEPTRYECLGLGIMINQNAKAKIRFVDDPSIPKREVGDTCERCAVECCKERAAQPIHHERRQKDEQTARALEAEIERRTQL